MDTVVHGVNSFACTMQGNTYLQLGESGVCYNATQIYFYLLIALVVCLTLMLILKMLESWLDNRTIARLTTRIAELEAKESLS